jgi:hydroxypyruvate isomerase
MKTRRGFLQTVMATAALCAAPLTEQVAAKERLRPKFKLKYAPHFGQFEAHAGKDVLDQLRFMADHGFTALEDNALMKRPAALQEQIGRTLAQLGMTMGVFVVDLGGNRNSLFTTGKAENAGKFKDACEAAVATAERVNASWMTVVPGVVTPGVPLDIQTGHVIDVLRAGADVFESRGLVMVIEPLSDSPDLFLRTAEQAYAICRGVNSPACKILYDMYHLQMNRGALIPSIDLAWNEIAYFQIGDAPGRLWPGTGEINYRNVLAHIHKRMRGDERDFIFGMEHAPWGGSKEDERACIEAYVAVDSFT